MDEGQYLAGTLQDAAGAGEGRSDWTKPTHYIFILLLILLIIVIFLQTSFINESKDAHFIDLVETIFIKNSM